ncbi:hypothetical protein PTTW11_10761 [Pyrenophora teres f. teres]|uniref:Uncharacterized protein n=1 Tax=Pyrenophora teres f. teres TaxID=97479 RepID=A0A6S6WGX2_9PLEO|nr:hypothetical protein PTTW11_10761 [Pyrenophora teres f. teres]
MKQDDSAPVHNDHPSTWNALPAYRGDSQGSGFAVTFNHQYESIDEKAAHTSIKTRQYRAIGIGVVFLLAVLAIGSAISILSQPTSTSMGECGRTPEQARANGCIFDLMMSGWVHPPCYPQELSDQFLRENSFAFFRDREGTQPMPEAEARLGNYKFVYTNGSFHYQHCSYIWAKQLRARTSKPYILDSQSRSVEHVQHCVQRTGSPNVTQYPLQTGTKLSRSTWKIDCIIGDREVHTAH